jgi:hypothetical protein
MIDLTIGTVKYLMIGSVKYLIQRLMIVFDILQVVPGALVSHEDVKQSVQRGVLQLPC